MPTPLVPIIRYVIALSIAKKFMDNSPPTDIPPLGLPLQS